MALAALFRATTAEVNAVSAVAYLFLSASLLFDDIQEVASAEKISPLRKMIFFLIRFEIIFFPNILLV